MMGPPRGFLFLKSGAGRASGEVLEENFRLDALGGRPVIWDTYQRRYHVFEDWPGFWAWRDPIPIHKQCFDEVIFGAFAQRLKFDIDATGEKIDAIPPGVVRGFTAPPDAPQAGGMRQQGETIDEEFEALFRDDLPGLGVVDPAKTRQGAVDTIIGGLLEVILEVFQELYFAAGFAATPQDIVVMDSSGPAKDGHKYSFHILILTSAVANNEEAKGFTAQVLARLPPAIRELVDPQVNKSIQNFRLVGSSKPGSDRVLAVTTRFGTIDAPRADTIASAPPGALILPQIFADNYADKRARAPELSDKDLRVILEAVARSKADADHQFARARGGLLIFRRVRRGPCGLCDRIHDNDSTLMVSTFPVLDPGADPAVDEPTPHRVVEYCRRNAGASRTLAFVDLPLRPPYDGVAQKIAPIRAQCAAAPNRAQCAVERRVAAIHAGGVDAHLANATRLEELPPRQVLFYSEPSMRAYVSVPTLVVKGQMKLGKTRALREYLDRDFPIRVGGIHTPVIRMVSFRQTFSKSMQREHFRDFELYCDHAGGLDHVKLPRLLIQVESLHRIRMGAAPEPIDLLVLDEVESILAQFNSGLNKRFTAAFAMFRWMLMTAERVICMDANVGDRTLRILEQMRPTHPITFHWNQFLRAAGDRYYFSADRAIWLDHLFDRLSLGQRVVLPTNSLSEARTLRAMICGRHPDKLVRLYSSETSPSEKERDFADVHTRWADLDVLIYTPTLSAGVSYELEHFDVLFAFFTDASCGVETCRQMLGRVRDIATKEHFVYLSGRANHLPTDVDVIRRMLFDSRSDLYRTIDTNNEGPLALRFDYNAAGEMVFHESPYFVLWLETLRVENLSANAFVSRFIDQVADTGADVDLLFALPGENAGFKALTLEHSALKQGLALADSAAIAAAPDFDPDEVAAIRDQLSRQRDVPEADRLGVVKYQLRDTYKWHGRPIDPGFIAAYGKPRCARVYRNLLRITAADSVIAALCVIQDQEAGFNRVMMQNRLAAADNVACGFCGQFSCGLCGRLLASESRDLHHRYVFQSHFLAVWLLQFCGFSCIKDQTCLHEDEVYRKFKAREQQFLTHFPGIEFEFRLRCPDVWAITGEHDSGRYIAKTLAVVNKILRCMYGLEVRRKTKRDKRFCLGSTKIGRLFVFSQTPLPDDAPGGPKPHIPSLLAPVNAIFNPLNP